MDAAVGEIPNKCMILCSVYGWAKSRKSAVKDDFWQKNLIFLL